MSITAGYHRLWAHKSYEAHWLLRAHDLCDDQTLPLTQELLAQMIGVQRNAVSLVAHTLQQAGIIRYSRGHIEINDLEGLAQTSCECYRVVKTLRDRLLGSRARGPMFTTK